MKKRLFVFITPDGVTYSSPDETYPDVENLQVLGFGEGSNEEEAFEDFIKNNKWVLETQFNEVICIEVKSRIYREKDFI
ncbi:hypothetical protein [Thermococcus thioreducens]|uniref:Uncharacterized protein n=1 Tax=Thermococcus thioreducens TaxID=277988 RepID=A0A0Q2M1M5_9EURY|nr:hypothetical protein [Thermococcus thioreducens]ASJ13397.1 hypothetical protein A3L14_11125 [Thermococcus thioreducens]KQH81754.1 hypothetical protein AMR53_09345 [Thermococcus thioreducens]SEW23852.1 hypothetical protein SAMN05216170_2336 [Thermococcus thioreducens]